MRARRLLTVLVLSSAVVSPAGAETRAIDPERSTLTVHVFKSGLLSAFGDNHEISAPIASGTVEDGAEPGVEISVDARRMTVRDPDLAPAKRSEVQKRMLGPEALDVARFAEIKFRSTAVKPLSAGRWRVEGVLTLHGKSVPLTFDVAGENGQVRGSANVSQKAFGIQPISAAGGTVKVKDEVRVDFEIATAPAAAH